MDHLAQLSKEELLAIIAQQAEMIALLLQQGEELKQEIQRLKGPKPGASQLAVEPPAWVKANTLPKEPPEVKSRKKRAHNFTRPRETPTEEIVSVCDACPDCGRTLSGGTEYSRPQIIALPAIALRVIDYLTQVRYCGVCQKTCVAAPDLSAIAVGQSRFGQQVHALVAYLRQVGRLPLRPLAALLWAFCRLKVSVGEVNRMLASVANLGKTSSAALQKRLRKSDYVHGDETRWRENGQNGYLWSFSTPSVCYFTYPKSRAGQVVTDVLGSDYPGMVVSDFYGGYNAH